jgi:hypothetical protein
LAKSGSSAPDSAWVLPTAPAPREVREPFHRRLQRFCYLHRRSACYRLERQLPGGTRTR